jgi:outer membrane protein assembly factor BamD (BamD/ComL family)
MLGTAVAMTAQGKKNPDQTSGYDRAARATLLRPANVFVAPEISSQKITLVTPGHEVVISETSGEWVRVFANTDVQEEREEEKPEFTNDDAVSPKSGWVLKKGVVSPATPNGDKILYGAAATSEAAAMEPHAAKMAAASAYLMYRRLAEYFPDSPLAGEAAWRSADIRWQMEKVDLSTLGSAKEDAALRPQRYDADLKRVIKMFPNTKYAANAAYDLLDTKLCGDWQGLPKCPMQESGVYEKYASQFPDGPKTAQALWNALYRQGVLVSMYTAEENPKRADVAAAHAKDLAGQIQQKFPQSDYAPRAAAMIYRIEQKIPVYGNDRE